MSISDENGDSDCDQGLGSCGRKGLFSGRVEMFQI